MALVYVKGIITFEAINVAEYIQQLSIDDVSFALIDELNLQCSFSTDVENDLYQDQLITSCLEHICASIVIATGVDIVGCEITETRIPEDNTRTIHQTGNARIVQYDLSGKDLGVSSELANRISNNSSPRVWSAASLIYSAETTKDNYGKFWLLYGALQLLSVGQFEGNDRQRVNQLMMRYAGSTEPSHMQTVISDFGSDRGQHISIVTATRDAFSHDNATFNNGQSLDLRYQLVLPSVFKMLPVCKKEIANIVS